MCERVCVSERENDEIVPAPPIWCELKNWLGTKALRVSLFSCYMAVGTPKFLNALSLNAGFSCCGLQI